MVEVSLGSEIYFAQFTDIHICTKDTAEAANAERFLAGALHEVASLRPSVACIVVTGDIGSTETEPELRRYRELVENTVIPIYAVPSGNHDAWRSDEPWNRWMGEHRHCIDLGPLRLILLGEVERGHAPTWRRNIGQEELDWVSGCLQEAGNRPTIVGFHSPLCWNGSRFYSPWEGLNIPQFLQVLTDHHVLAAITGHWHVNAEWRVEPGNLRLICTGALCGWNWNGVPPTPRYGLRPGYQLLRVCNGTLQTFWRDLDTPTQVSLVAIDDLHTTGPRPQVRSMHIGRPVRLHVQTMSLNSRVENIEWAVYRADGEDPVGRIAWRVQPPGWTAMALEAEHLWCDWTGEFSPEAYSPGEALLVVRAANSTSALAYDSIPVTLSVDGIVRAERMQLFIPWSLRD